MDITAPPSWLIAEYYPSMDIKNPQRMRETPYYIPLFEKSQIAKTAMGCLEENWAFSGY